jgi:hypothetical protein
VAAHSGDAALIVTQEMCARMGAVTGKGLADLIRENFGVKVTALVLFLFVFSPTSATPRQSSPESPLPRRSSARTSRCSTSTCSFALADRSSTPMITRGNYDRRKDLLCVLRRSISPTSCQRDRRPPAVARGAAPDGFPALFADASAYRADGDRRDRHDDLALDAVLHPIRDRREGRAKAKDYAVLTNRRRSREPIFTDVIAFFIIVASAATIFVHNAHVPHGAQPDRGQRRRRRRCRARAAGGQVRIAPVRARLAERGDLHGLDLAAVDGVLRL